MLVEPTVTVRRKREIGKADVFVTFSVLDEDGNELQGSKTPILHLGEGETGTWDPVSLEVPPGGRLVVHVVDKDWRLGHKLALAAADALAAHPAILTAAGKYGWALIPGLKYMGELLGDDAMGSWIVLPPSGPGEMTLDPPEEGPAAAVTLRWLDPDPAAAELSPAVGEPDPAAAELSPAVADPERR